MPSGYLEFRRTFDLNEPIDDAVVDKLVRQIRQARSDRCAGGFNAVTLKIDCGGGDVVSAETLARCLLEGRPVDARIDGACHSSALIVLSACRGSRSAHPASTYCFHRVESCNPRAAFRDRAGRFTALGARELLATLRHADRQIVNALCEGFACARDEVEGLMDANAGRGTTLSAQQMLERGYIYEIRPRPANPAMSENRRRILQQRERLAALFPGLWQQ